MDSAQLNSLLASFQSCKILVVGDLMLDEFIWGKVSRISPEAPVPVVQVTKETYFAGGSANVARNLCPFCPDVHIMGLIGDDSHGRQLVSLLESDGIILDKLLLDREHQTIVKSRIIARQQQVVRVDREKKIPPTDEQVAQFLDAYRESLEDIDAVILEDYGKGFFTQELVDTMVQVAKEKNITITADINPHNPLHWHGLTTVKPNRSEAFAAVGIPESDPVDPATEDEALQEVGSKLLEQWQCENLLITLGEQGVMLFSSEAPPYHSPTRAREVFDVSGAGDTAIALFTLALASGSSPQQAAEISNHASGVVVGKLGTATLTPDELRHSFENHG